VKFTAALINGVLISALPILAQVPKKANPSPVPQQSSQSASAAVAQCEALRHHGDPGTRTCYQRLSHSTDPALQAEGLWGLADYNGANEVFKALIKARPKDANLRVRWGRMYLEHWQPADAAECFGEALEIDEKNAQAVLGLALVAADGFEGKASELAKRALTLDPKLVEAQELLARVALEDNDPVKAEAEAKKALEISPEALNAMAILATVDWLNDKENSPWMDKALKINPMYGEGYETAGHFFVINRRYDEGIKAYRKAIAIKPDLWSARSELGVNLMRFGEEAEARANLEECFNAGYKSAGTVNSLRLLDKYKNYDTFKTPTTVLRLDKKESALLRPYFQSELDLAMATYEKKYKFKLSAPVQVEVYPNHDDFAVRTMALPGLGALGVTFGNFVAMDSPSGRKPGEFHWASTMWHELSHVYVLSMTNSRVPRWFTEGLAVFEETGNGHPDWGDRLDPEAINAIKDHKLLPVAELDRGFIHPTYPSQVIVSYFQGGKICNFINEKWGYDKLLAMIHDYAALEPTPEVIEKEFKMKPEEFDKQFLAWLDKDTHATVAGFDEWKKSIRTLSESEKAKNWDDVIKQGTAIRDLYADYVEAANVYEFLAEAYLAKDDKPKAIAELERYSSVGGRNPATLKRLATLEVENGRKPQAVQTLERLNLIYLKDEQAHRQLGDLYMDLGNPTNAIREYQAVLAGSPIDVAGAHYQLAKAFQAVKRVDDAREEVISALEAAPGFKPAQKLLLELGAEKPDKKSDKE
jgi:cellulose synthase operon protein C